MSKIRDMLNFTPAASVTALQDEMNRFFNHFYSRMQVGLTDWDAQSPSAPAINLSETSESFKVEAALPGYEVKDVKVETVGTTLTISGTRRDEKKEERADSYLRQEISYGSFTRSVTLPETADGGKSKAEFRNGILTVSVPKKAEAMQKPQKIEIKQAA